MSIQFLVPLMEGRESWHAKLLASFPPGADIVHTKARPLVRDTRYEVLSKATADYVAMIDDDDELDPIEVKKLMDYVEANQPLAVMTNSMKIDFYGKRLRPFIDLSNTTYSNFLSQNKFPHQLIVCRREEAIRAWEAADAYIQTLYDDYVQEPKGVNPRAAFDPAFCWEVLLSGQVTFYAPYCYLWRVHSREQQLHIVANDRNMEVLYHYQSEFKRKFKV